MINKKQFDVLEYLCTVNNGATQREIAIAVKMSLGTINKLISELTELGLIKNTSITIKGVKELEPYKVQRMVIIAAGFGSRLVPITLNTPKPLVRVKGQRIIDSLLDAAQKAEIPEIYIVRGYLAEQFDQLLYKYPNIKFIENPMYNEANNILSVACAGPLLKNAYITEADLLVKNAALIKKYQYQTNYLAIPMKKTDDWCMYLKNGIVNKLAVGGTDCYQMVGISYWTQADGARLVEHVKEVLNAPGGKERYWDQVALEYHLNDYSVYLRECSQDDIVEIDTYSDLKKIDKTYC